MDDLAVAFEPVVAALASAIQEAVALGAVSVEPVSSPEDWHQVQPSYCRPT